jgi:two-component system alkaline phosphatase synthesis response regulator PhoP
MAEAKKAVVVDDDPKIVMLVDKALQRLGYQVFDSADGNMALELVKKEKPQLLITDILLPGIDGVDLCRAVKTDAELQDTKVIMVTGVYNEANFRLEMECSADAFIEKPLDIGKLERLVEEKVNGCCNQ